MISMAPTPKFKSSGALQPPPGFLPLANQESQIDTANVGKKADNHIPFLDKEQGSSFSSDNGFGLA